MEELPEWACDYLQEMLLKTSKFSVLTAPVTVRSSDIQSLSKERQVLFESIIPPSLHHTSLEQSRAERRARQQSASSLTYGEINFDSFSDIIHTIKYDLGGLSGGEVFCDLGSGSGKAVFAASILHDFKRCCGIEILASLHSLAQQSLQVWNASTACNQQTHIEFFQGSIFDNSLHDWTDADVIFANSTCFTEVMMIDLSEIAGRMRMGSYAITFTRPLLKKNGFRVVNEIRKDMSWGMADVFIHRKVRDWRPDKK